MSSIHAHARMCTEEELATGYQTAWRGGHDTTPYCRYVGYIRGANDETIYLNRQCTSSETEYDCEDKKMIIGKKLMDVCICE